MAKDVIEPIPRNPFLGAASDGLRTARDKLDYVPMPEFLGGGLGNLLVGEAPEELDRLSYGWSPFYEARGDNVIPRLRPERVQGVVDTTLLPVAEAYGAAKLAGRGLRGMAESAGRAVDKTLNRPTDASRRKFVKDAGKVTAGSAVAAATPDVFKALTKTAARATPREFYTAYRTGVRVAADEASNAVWGQYAKELDGLRKAAYESFLATPKGQRYKEAIDAESPELEHMESLGYGWQDAAGPEHLIPYDDAEHFARRASTDAWDKAYDEGLRKLRADPRYADYKTPSELENIAMADGRAGDVNYTNYWKEARKIGMLPDEEIVAALKQGKTYMDPTTDNLAFLDKSGNLMWRSPDGGTAASQHTLKPHTDLF